MLFKFTQITSFFLFSLTVGSAVASPALDNAALAKRDNADVLAVLNTLKGSTDTILPQISSAVTAGPTEETLTPLINDLTTALNTATSSLGGLSATSRRGLKRQSDDEIANLIATIVTDITNALEGLVGDLATIPGLGGLLSGVDLALSQVLKGVEVLLAGVLNLVATLLVDVAALLTSLAFGLTLASIGL